MHDLFFHRSSLGVSRERKKAGSLGVRIDAGIKYRVRSGKWMMGGNFEEGENLKGG